MDSYEKMICVSCDSCGAPVGFDIIGQTYKCAHCGTVTDAEHAKQAQLRWRTLAKDEIFRSEEKPRTERYSCPRCGAELLFAEGEASETCEFCGNNLVSSELGSDENIPELLIPFFITEDEARERLGKWGKDNEKQPEGRSLLNNIGKLKGCYLPYRLVRGPVQGTVSRDGSERKYQCAGFLEGIAVNTSSQLDNLVLNDIEPFDWSAAKPFSYGYVAGHRVKLNDISDAAIDERIKAETVQDFLPEIQKTMQTTGVDVELRTGDLTSLSVLLPVYFIRSGSLTAVMNGQTGRIAVSQKRRKKAFPWAIEPTVWTLLCTLLFALWTHFAPEAPLIGLCVFGCIFFAAMSEGRGPLTKRITLKSKAASASRTDGELKIDESRNILKNPYDNTPVFFENDENGAKVPVKIRFYGFTRTLSMILNSLVTIALPLIIAAVIRLMIVLVQGGSFADKFKPQYGAAWYTLAAMIVLIYFVKGVRSDVYDHPLLYAKTPNGQYRLMGSRRDRKVTVLSMFGIGRTDKDGKRITLLRLLCETGKEGILFAVLFIAILLGSTLAIIF